MGGKPVYKLMDGKGRVQEVWPGTGNGENEDNSTLV